MVMCAVSVRLVVAEEDSMMNGWAGFCVMACREGGEIPIGDVQ